MISNTKDHFSREEAEMQRIKYPRFLGHKLEHDNLITRVAGLRTSFFRGKSKLTIQVSAFLRHWLRNHIMQTDKLLPNSLK